MKRYCTLAMASVAILVSLDARAVNYCGGETHQDKCNKPYHPFPCCSYVGPNNGNCTWWAWESACRNWGEALGVYGNANQWAAEAAAAGWPVKDHPADSTVFVRLPGEFGHVGWIYSAQGDSFCSTEQSCHTWIGVKSYCHAPGYA